MNALDFGTRPDHVGIHVYSLDEETKWIHDVLDFEFTFRIGLPIGHFPRSAFHTLGDFQFEVYQTDTGGKTQRTEVLLPGRNQSGRFWICLCKCTLRSKT